MLRNLSEVTQPATDGAGTQTRGAQPQSAPSATPHIGAQGRCTCPQSPARAHLLHRTGLLCAHRTYGLEGPGRQESCSLVLQLETDARGKGVGSVATG